MKTLSEVLELVSQAIECTTRKNEVVSKAEWMIDYYGHVNELVIKYYPFGWSDKSSVVVEKCAVYLTENGIQEAYWFLYNRLNIIDEIEKNYKLK